MNGLDAIDQKLLGLLQAAFPLVSEPYADLGLKLGGIDGTDVIRRIDGLKAKGVVRQISPVLDARKLGYQSTLVAMKVSTEHMTQAEIAIRQHPGISHGYERDHDFNIWVTLSVPPEADINIELKKLAASVGAERAVNLPVVKMFKLRAIFGVDDDTDASNGSNGGLPQTAGLSRLDRLIINGLQQDLPLVPSPFTPLASRLGLEVDDFLGGCQSLLERGVIRRFGAAINHHKAGYKANAMACWAVTDSMVEIIGQKLASLREVSHCYERKTGPLWRYNLFAMIHGHTRTDCEKIASQVSAETDLSDHVMLFSTKEFKKTRIKYTV